MDFVYASWSVEQHVTMPILNIRGSCEQENSDGIMLGEAVRLIERAEEFKGIPCQDSSDISVYTRKAKVIVRFSLIFPDNRRLEGFVEKYFD